MNKLLAIRFIVCCFILFGTTISAQVSTWEWAKSERDTLDDVTKSVAIDAFGNTYVTGYFCGASITIGSTTLFNIANNSSGNLSDMLLVKYDPSGNILWAKNAGEFLPDAGNSVTVDAFDNIIVVGYFQSSYIAFGTDTLTNLSGGAEIFIVKYDSLGNVLWAKNAGGNSDDGLVSAISTDASGNCYITGNFKSPTITFGSITLTNANSNGYVADMFIAKYDSSGNVLWANSVGGMNDESANAIITDASGNSYVAGEFRSSAITFGATTLNNASTNYYDIFLVKYDALGNVLWATKAGGLSDDRATGVSKDNAGNSYITGDFASSSLVFGSTTLINAGSSDLFLAKYDPSGNALWANSNGGSVSDGANSVAVDASGIIYVAGYFSSSNITFGSTTLYNSGMFSDIFVVQYDVFGNAVWATTAAGGTRDAINSIVVDASGDVYVAGYFYSSTLAIGTFLLPNYNGTEKEANMFTAKIGKTDNVINYTVAEGNIISIFPNPSSGIFHLEINNGTASNAEIEIYDVLGKIVFKSVILNSETNIDLSSAAKGIYFYHVVNETGTVGTGKLVVK